MSADAPVSFQQAARAAEKARDLLAHVPGVVLIGVGTKYVGGKPTAAWTVSVSVEEKKPKSALSASEMIPAEIDGVPTDVSGTGAFRTLGTDKVDGETDAYDFTLYRPLRGGIKIEISYASTSGIEPDMTVYGTMGCVALTTETPPRHVLLTNRHVIWQATPHGPVGQPHPYPGSTCCGSGSELIGNIFNWAKDEAHPDYEDVTPVDAAICALTDGMKWIAGVAPHAIGKNENPEPIGNIRDLRPSVTPSPPQNLPVKKRGMKTGLTTGTIKEFYSSKQLTVHGQIITGAQVFDPASNFVLNVTVPVLVIAADTPPFAKGGDSGSLVRDTNNNVVGLLFSSNPAGTICLAAHIQPVLDALHLTIPTTGAFPAEQTVPANNNPYKKIEVSTDQMEKLQEDLLQTAHGTALVRTLTRHVPEISGLIQTNRRAATVWLRIGGPHLVHDLVAATKDPELPFLRLDRDVAIAAARRLSRILYRFGSDRLRADLGRLTASAERLIGLRYRELLQQLDAGPVI